MNERVRIPAKKPDAKRENRAFQTRKINLSQSISSPVDRILSFQRTIGNQAVKQLIKSGTLQAKLKIGMPNDIYEQEAERVAERVMQQKCTSAPGSLPCGEEEVIQPKTIGIPTSVQRQPEEEEELIQRRLNQAKGGGYPLTEQSRFFMENRFGMDFSPIKMHTDPHAAHMARALNAEAFTSGQDVYFAAGKYNPDSLQGKNLIAHELTHVIQQGGAILQTKNRSYENRPSIVRSSVPQIQRYGPDVHQDMTEREALNASPGDPRAIAIANADQAVDTGWRHPWIRTPREFVDLRISGRDMLHFPARSVAVNEVNAAIGTCNTRNFGTALHRYQDSYSHGFPPGVVSPVAIATSFCWALNPTLAAAILLSNPLYGRRAVLKHVCLLTYPDNYRRGGAQGARDTNMRNGTRRFLAAFFRRCASRVSPPTGGDAASPGAAAPSATPCVHPINWTHTNPRDHGADAIRVDIAWQSSTGNLSDLRDCTVREVVNYNPIPNPPFLWNPPNPTILTVPGINGAAMDTHSYPPGLRNGITNPRQAGTMTANQVYQYRCTGPGCSGTWTDFARQIYRITRKVFGQFVRLNPWRYRITKEGTGTGNTFNYSREVEIPEP